MNYLDFDPISREAACVSAVSEFFQNLEKIASPYGERLKVGKISVEHWQEVNETCHRAYASATVSFRVGGHGKAT